MTYQESIKNAKHHKALGQTEIYLREEKLEELPWHLATDCEPGGSHRMEISTNVWFHGLDRKTGLKFRWSFDIEPYSANGTGSYQIDTAGCRKVLALLPPKAAEKFREYLGGCASSVRKKGNEWKAIADRQYRDADTLDSLVNRS